MTFFFLVFSSGFIVLMSKIKKIILIYSQVKHYFKKHCITILNTTLLVRLFANTR